MVAFMLPPASAATYCKSLADPCNRNPKSWQSHIFTSDRCCAGADLLARFLQRFALPLLVLLLLNQPFMNQSFTSCSDRIDLHAQKFVNLDSTNSRHLIFATDALSRDFDSLSLPAKNIENPHCTFWGIIIRKRRTIHMAGRKEGRWSWEKVLVVLWWRWN